MTVAYAGKMTTNSKKENTLMAKEFNLTSLRYVSKSFMLLSISRWLAGRLFTAWLSEIHCWT